MSKEVFMNALYARRKLELEVAILKAKIHISDDSFFMNTRCKIRFLSDKEKEAIRSLVYRNKVTNRNPETCKAILEDIFFKKELVSEKRFEKVQKALSIVGKDDEHFWQHLEMYMERCKMLNRKLQILAVIEYRYQKIERILRSKVRRGDYTQDQFDELLAQRNHVRSIRNLASLDEARKEYNEIYSDSYIGNVYKISGKWCMVVEEQDDNVLLMNTEDTWKMNRIKFFMAIRNNEDNINKKLESLL